MDGGAWGPAGACLGPGELLIKAHVPSSPIRTLHDPGLWALAGRVQPVA
jgi:hypothetical protein